jgi:hypothetical protein
MDVLCAHLNLELRSLSLVGLNATPLDRLFRKLSSVTDLTLIYESRDMPVPDFPSLFPRLAMLEIKIGL